MPACATRTPRDHIRSLLGERPGLARVPARETYVPTRLLFGEAAFLIAPTAQEIDAGVLVPGHRFYPFLSESVAPNEMRVTAADGSPLALEKQVWPFANMLIYHSLMSPPDMLFLCRPMENAIPPEPTAPVEFDAYDMAAFYRANGFSEGDLILARVLDYEAGGFSLACVDAQTRLLLQKEMHERDRLLEDILLELLPIFGPELPLRLVRDAYAQLFLDGVDLSKPASAFGPFLNQSERLGLLDYHMQPCLVPRETDPLDFYGSAPVPEYDGRCENLEDMLVKGDLSFGLSFVRAAILDEMDRESDDREAVIARLFEGRLVLQWNREDRAFFREEFDRLWEETRVRRRELSPNAQVRTQRARVLARCDAQLALLRELDQMGVMPEELPMQQMTALATIDGMYHQILEFLEHAPAAEELAQLDAQLSTMEDHEDGVRKHFETILEGGEGAVNWNQGDEDWVEDWEFDEPVTAYVLRVKFQQAKRIWRKIEIAEQQSLHQLHAVIQDAIGWDGDHLYSFFMSNRPWDRTTEITSPYNEDADVPSAAHVRLQDLELAPKQKFLYLFDFGDEHRFEVEVVEIRPDAPAGEYPVIVDSRGQAPEQYGWG